MNNKLESLVEVSRAINSVLELDQLLETIMDAAINVIGVERGIVFLKGADGELDARVVRNVEKQTLADAEEISRSITSEVAASGKYVLSSNVLDDPNVMNRPSVRAFKIRSVLCVPLVSKDAIIGTLYLDSRKATKMFVEDDVEFLTTFANLAAIAIENALLYDASRKEARYWKEEAGHQHGGKKIVHESEKVKECLRRVQSVAHATVSVLITGESGTGKELIARAIHYGSPRRDKKFVPINCSALPEQILEAELFGAKKGAYTGAVADMKGLFEEADGGTIFFDEIADMQPNLQAKLLRVLQEGEIRRVGDTQYRFINVRVLSATNKDIREEIAEGNFREDLFYRLCGMQIHVPPLRERREDILPLVYHVVAEFCREQQLPLKQISPAAIAKLQAYSYPGNVRELQNIVRRAALLAEASITEDNVELPELSPLPNDAEGFNEATCQHIIRILEKVGWNQTRAAELLGLNRTTLQAKMKKLKITRHG